MTLVLPARDSCARADSRGQSAGGHRRWASEKRSPREAEAATTRHRRAAMVRWDDDDQQVEIQGIVVRREGLEETTGVGERPSTPKSGLIYKLFTGIRQFRGIGAGIRQLGMPSLVPSPLALEGERVRVRGSSLGRLVPHHIPLLSEPVRGDKKDQPNQQMHPPHTQNWQPHTGGCILARNVLIADLINKARHFSTSSLPCHTKF